MSALRLLSILLRVLLVLIPAGVFGHLLVQELVPSGTFLVRHAAGERSAFIDRLLPDARVVPPGTIVDEPVTFFAHPHRSFDTVEAEVWFKNGGAPIVELGALAQGAGEAYDLHPLQNLLIDGSAWDRLDEDGVVLLQRRPRFSSIDGFLADQPPREQVATSHFSLPKPYRISGYQPSLSTRTIDATLRGPHEFKTYVKGETMAFSFAFMDMNRDEGADAVSIVVFDEDGAAVADTSALDDGNVSDDARPSTTRRIDLVVPGLPEGVYKVEMRTTRDLFFRTITTTQQRVSFLNEVFLGDEAGYKEPARSVRFWTEAKHMNVSTTHADAVQALQVGRASVEIPRPYVKVGHEVTEDGVVRVTVPAGDVLVEGDGHVAFSPEMFFNPDPVRLDWNTDLDRLGVDYVIATYETPRAVDGWTVARAAFDAKKLALTGKAWKFVFSVPGVKALGAAVEVGRIDMAWKRPPLSWQEFAQAVQERLGTL